MAKTKEDMLSDILALIKILKKKLADDDDDDFARDALDDIASTADDLGTKQHLGGMSYNPEIDAKGNLDAEIDDDVVSYNGWNIKDLNKSNMEELWKSTRKEFTEYQQKSQEWERKESEKKK